MIYMINFLQLSNSREGFCLTLFCIQLDVLWSVGITSIRKQSLAYYCWLEFRKQLLQFQSTKNSRYLNHICIVWTVLYKNKYPRNLLGIGLITLTFMMNVPIKNNNTPEKQLINKIRRCIMIGKSNYLLPPTKLLHA